MEPIQEEVSVVISILELYVDRLSECFSFESWTNENFNWDNVYTAFLH